MTRDLLYPFLLGCAGVALQACSCNPDLPPDPPPDPPVQTVDTAPEETADTAPPLPCAQPEVEPNNAPEQANLIALDQVACGDFAEDADFDFFTFEVFEDGWLGIRADSQDLGSAADVAVVVTADNGLSAQRLDNQDRNDVDLLFPVTPGRYDLVISEETGQGNAERFFYELLVTAAKIPVDYDAVAPGDNVRSSAAELVAPNQAIYGVLSDPFAPEHWFGIDVPPGKHTLTLSVTAFAEGSPADTSLALFTSGLEPLPDGCRTCEQLLGPGGAFDPVLTYDSPGNELVLFKVRDELGRAGPAFWYLLDIRLEGQ